MLLFQNEFLWKFGCKWFVDVEVNVEPSELVFFIRNKDGDLASKVVHSINYSEAVVISAARAKFELALKKFEGCAEGFLIHFGVDSIDLFQGVIPFEKPDETYTDDEVHWRMFSDGLIHVWRKSDRGLVASAKLRIDGPWFALLKKISDGDGENERCSISVKGRKIAFEFYKRIEVRVMEV